MENPILLISERPDDRVFAQAIAAKVNSPLLVAATSEQAAQAILQQRAQIILVDTSSQLLYERFEAMIRETIGLFSDQINANAIHFLSSEPLENVSYLIQSPLFGHFVIRDKSKPEEAGAHYAKIIRATFAERAFGLNHLLGDRAQIQTVKLQVSSDKQNTVEAVKRYLLAAKFNSRMSTVIANAVDELIMNAIFDAPVDEVGRQTLASTSRAAAVKLEGRHAVEMQIGFDGQYVGINAIDLFGSLDKLKLLTHISKIYTVEEYKVKTAVAGAGIGLATVFRSGGSFFFVSEGQLRTEVTVLFKRTENFREFKNQFRFISTQFYF